MTMFPSIMSMRGQLQAFTEHVEAPRLGMVLMMLMLLAPLIYCFYNLFLHPLSNFPGPKRAAIAPFWAMKHWISGENLRTMKEVHDRYGPVVRISPNQLSFCTSASWKDIHGHKPGVKPFLKSSWYDQFPDDPRQIVSEFDPVRHAAMRKTLSHGFSATALATQEDRVQHFVDLLIVQIAKHCTQAPGDMTKWYNYATFDVIGELAFGEPFGCLESGKPHFWIDILFGTIKNSNFMRSFEYTPALRSLIRIALRYKLLPKQVYDLRAKMSDYARTKLEKRLAHPPDRIDFLSRMISERADWTGTKLQDLQQQAALLVVAGSETTATALSAITYYLCRNNAVYTKLTSEIRGAFSSIEDIKSRTTTERSLPYLQAVIDEGLRLYPPIAAGLPRVSPGAMVAGHYVPPGVIVSVNTWVAGHIEANFHDAFAFSPERWLDSSCKDDKASSQPFLLGSRGCLGRNLALLELRLILAKMLWTFDMSLVVDDSQWDWVEQSRNYVFWEKPELPVQFRFREGVSVT